MDSSPESAAKLVRAASEAPDLTRRRSAAAKGSRPHSCERATAGGGAPTAAPRRSQPLEGLGLACSVSLSLSLPHPFPPCACSPLDSVVARGIEGGGRSEEGRGR